MDWLIVSSQLYFTINLEEIFYFGNKKCRIYAAFGVSQTPKWDLQQCINERDVIKLLLPDKEKKVVLPLALWIADGELYLIGYGMTKKLEAVPVREIESFRMEQKKFSREIAEQFKNTDWKKIIQEQKERKKMEDGTTEKEN